MNKYRSHQAFVMGSVSKPINPASPCEKALVSNHRVMGTVSHLLHKTCSASTDVDRDANQSLCLDRKGTLTSGLS